MAENRPLSLQPQADLLDAPVVRAAQTEASALGAAHLAGLAVGLWQDDDLAALWHAERRFAPASSADHERVMARWRRAVAAVRAFGDPSA